ncbi:hypothetical protein IC229_29865, partial [Spirosoma sp. BT702]
MALAAGQDNLCPNQTTSLTATGCNGEISWAGYTGTEAVRTNLGPGTYTVYCTTDCNNPTTKSYIIGGLQGATQVKLEAVGNVTSVCPGGGTTIHADGCSGSDLQWRDHPEWATEPTHPVGVGSYTVICSQTCGTSTAIINITQKDASTQVSLGADESSVCPGGETTIHATNCTGGTLSWRDHGDWGSNANPTVGVGSYTVTCSQTCGTSTTSIDITQKDASTQVSLGADESSVCPGGETTIHATNCTGGTLSWRDHGDWGSNANPTVGVGSYTVTCSQTCGTST